MTRALHWLGPAGSPIMFPPPAAALAEPNGLLAAGGDLAPERVLAAYRHGIFPWYEEGQPILWWSPDPRTVILPAELHVSRRFRRELRRRPFEASFDTDFAAVVRGCARLDEPLAGTWITPDMMAAYQRLHELGHAHSLEIWQAGRLVGGLYGVALGRAFFAESMYSRVSNASKAALAHLAGVLGANGFRLIDCQLPSAHLARLGARELPRRQFLALLREAVDAGAPPAGCWSRARVPALPGCSD
ncbi:leucyl/phenylalanyl-tRNA--protein transferase [Thioalkalivibrio sp. XN8]|uniref:leucyl/phenylalanyl-tRNA--protein transferase n=1 Tax=Thioalkalivibrio sp. XN8 TaxID=2712863 RepID=UPI003211E4A6